MRIICGKYKGKRLMSPQSDKVRPTSDRIKETVFNILSNRIEFDGIIALDLFAGSGALGIETLSRGASDCVFVDIDQLSNKLIAENLKIIGAKSQIFNADYRVAIKKLEGKQFDLIFLDPPYALKVENTALELILKHNILKHDGVIYIEHARDNPLKNIPDDFNIETRDCGNVRISFLSFKKQEE